VTWTINWTLQVLQHTNKCEYLGDITADMLLTCSPSCTVSIGRTNILSSIRDYIVIDKTSSRVHVHSMEASSSSCSSSRSSGQSSSNETSSDGYVIVNDGGAMVMGPAGEPTSTFTLFPGSKVPVKPCSLVISTRCFRWELLNRPCTFQRTRIW